MGGSGSIDRADVLADPVDIIQVALKEANVLGSQKSPLTILLNPKVWTNIGTSLAFATSLQILELVAHLRLHAKLVQHLQLV